MKKSCKLANQEHPKICEDFGKTKNEDSIETSWDLQEGETLFPDPEASYLEENT